jgi:hypothetical protein
MTVCPDCSIPIDDLRKRCVDCAYTHHKLVTAEQRRIRTTELHGWDRPRTCKDCSAEFTDDKRYRSGAPKTRCPQCDIPKHKPKHPCFDCPTMVSAARRRCDACRTVHETALRQKYVKPRKPPVLCSVCGKVSTRKRQVCGPCGASARKREQSRLRCFRDRLFTTLVYTSIDVEFLINLLDSPCMYCQSTENITIEHIVPLIRGGQHNIENVGPACFSCNSSKQNQLVNEWRPELSI